MSLRQRTIQPTIVDKEQLHAMPAKTNKFVKPAATRRAVLGDVGNKLANQESKQLNVTKKGATKSSVSSVLAELSATNKQVQKKPTKTAAKTETKTEVTVEKSLLTLKREESKLSLKSASLVNASKTKDEPSYSTRQLMNFTDVDATDKDDPLLVTEYIEDIFHHLRSQERLHKIQENYLLGHKSTPRMRAVLVNWLVEVHESFEYLQETLHLCVSVLDRYLQLRNTVGRDTLQLVGSCAMLIAAKYEEIYAPEVNDLIYLSDNTFTRSQVIKLESDILTKLDWHLGRPLSLQFLRRYSKVARAKLDQHNLAKYFLEIFLLEYELCHIHPSIQAAAACCLSISILSEFSDPSQAWSDNLVYYSTYTFLDIRPTIVKLAFSLAKMEKSKHQAIRKKYATSKNGAVSVNPKLQGPLVKKIVKEVELQKSTAKCKPEV